MEEHRGGRMRRNLDGEAAFRSFVPAPLETVELRYDEELAGLLVRARLALHSLTGRFTSLSADEQANTMARAVRIEAESSLEIAEPELGLVHAPLARKLAFDAPDAQPHADGGEAREAVRAAEADNIGRAIEYGIWRAGSLPVCGRLAQELHGIALSGARHDAATPGWFRTSPAWMGERGSTPSTARYVAPVGEDMDRAVAGWERFANGEDGPDPLVRIALSHYQLAAARPFLDGNGRVARIVDQVMLVEAGLIPAPVLPLSSALLREQFPYFSNLSIVEREGDYERWVKFCLRMVADAARTADGLMVAAA